MVGSKGAKLGAVRLGGGIAGAALLAVALPVSNGWAAIGSPAPRPAEAAAIASFDRTFGKGPGDHQRPALVRIDGASPASETTVRIQRDPASATQGSSAGAGGERSCESPSGTGAARLSG